MRFPSVGAAVVAYHAHGPTLNRLLTRLVDQLARVVVVDNGGSAGVIAPALRERVMLLDPGDNVGLARGHNLALAQLFALGLEHVLLFDQDSLPLPGMVEQLLQAEQALLAAGLPVAAVGPLPVARSNGQPAGFVRFRAGRVQVVSQADEDLPAPVCRCDFLITSGTLLRRQAHAMVGAFDESLFIDNVDVEWCYRAHGQGLDCYGVSTARMEHSLGDRQQPLPWLGRSLVIHQPIRLYYITRNRWLLYRLPHVPLVWKLNDLPRMLAKLLLFATLVAPRGRYLRAGLAGMCDGLRGRGGAARRSY